MYARLYAELTDEVVRAYAAAAAEAAGLTVDDAWWPGVVRNLRTLLTQADLVAGGPGADGETGGPGGTDTAVEADAEAGMGAG